MITTFILLLVYIIISLIPFFIILSPIFIIAYVLVSSKKKQEQKKLDTYNQSDYAKQTDNSYNTTMNDKGNIGEYLIYEFVKHLPGYKRFLFNCYVPKKTGGLTEIDLIMIHEKGIYVFESKNYSGWVYGNENDMYWTQTFRNYDGIKKYKFYNPIKQNAGHIEALKNYLSFYPHITYYSYIVFDNQTTLKQINQETNRHNIVKRSEINEKILSGINQSPIILSVEAVNRIYGMLYPYTQLDDFVKKQHKETVQYRYK